MKIVLITNLFEPYSRGGAEKVVKILAEALARDSHEVWIVTTEPLCLSRNSWRIQQKKYEKNSAYSVIRFFPWNFYFLINDCKYPIIIRFFWHILDTFNIYSFFKVRSILKKIQPDIVWTHNLKGLGLLTPLAIRFLHLKHVHTLHDIQLIIPSGILLFGEEQKWKNNNFWITTYTWITKFFFGSPHLILSPSTWLLDFYVQRGFFSKSKREILLHPFASSIEGQFALPANNTTLTFLYVGQIEHHKGIFFLLDVMREFVEYNDRRSVHSLSTDEQETNKSASIIKICLIIIGSGSKEKLLKEEIKNMPYVQYFGRLSYHETEKWYQMANYLIFPTLCYENSPNVIQEALFHKLPVLASKLGSISEFIENGKNGFLFAPGDSQKLLELFKEIQEGKKIISFTSSRKSFSPKEYLKRIFYF